MAADRRAFGIWSDTVTAAMEEKIGSGDAELDGAEKGEEVLSINSLELFV